MKNEFYKLNKSHCLYILILLSVVSVVLFSFHYYQNKIEFRIDWVPNIERYDHSNEIKERMNDLRIQLEQLSPMDDDYDIMYTKLTNEIDIYNYLFNNYIPYNQLIEYESLQIYRNHRVAYLDSMLYLISYLIICVSLVLSLYFVSLDFLFGTQKNVYTRGEKRTTIIMNKYALLIIILTVLFLLLLCIGYIMGLDYNKDKTHILFTNNKVQSLEINAYIILNFISVFFNTFVLSSTLFFLTVLIRKFIPSIIMLIVFIFTIIFLIPMSFPNLTFFFYGMPPLDWYAMNGNLFDTSIFVFFKLLILFIIMISALYSFNHKDLI